jgi:hypothetical protein
MGVANSKRKYSGGPNYSTKRGSDAEDGKGKEGEEGKGEEEAPPAETDPEKIKLANLKMWGPVLKAFMDNKEVKTKIKQAVDKQSAEGDGFIDKKILFTADDAQAYVSGKESHPLTQFYIDDLDKIYLFNPDFKKILEDLSKGSEGQPVRKMIKIPKEDKDTMTKMIPTLLDGPTHIMENVKRAVRHKALMEIIKYVLSSKEFKKAHKDTLEGQRSEIESGSKSKEEAAIAMKEENGQGAAPAGDKAPGGESEAGGGGAPSAIDIAKTIVSAVAEAKGGATSEVATSEAGASEAGAGASEAGASEAGASESGSESESASEAADSESEGGSDTSSMSSMPNSEFDSGSEGGSDNSSTYSIDPLTGGKIFKTAEEKESKKFKKAEQAGLEEKKKAFLLDTVKLVKYIDENQDQLLALYSKATMKSLGLASNIDKSAPKDAVIESLFQVVNTYVKEPDMAGAAGVPPPAAEGEAGKDGAKDGEKKADGAADGDKKADGPADGAEKKDDSAGKDVAPAGPPVVGGSPEEIVQGGGGTKAVPKKKKKFTRKKPQHIKISINVGNKNVISSDSSSSDSSSSDSESSSSDSSSSSSESESDEEDRKQKYTVNKVKKRSKSTSSV